VDLSIQRSLQFSDHDGGGTQVGGEVGGGKGNDRRSTGRKTGLENGPGKWGSVGDGSILTRVGNIPTLLSDAKGAGNSGGRNALVRRSSRSRGDEIAGVNTISP